MPRIEDVLIRSVFYIYPSVEDAESGQEEGATGFFYREPSSVIPRLSYIYAVTNQHVVFDDGMENPVLRVNNKDGDFDIFQSSRDDWMRHPDGDDIAICPIELDLSRHSFGCFMRSHILDEQFLTETNLGVGDEVFMIGRFRARGGQTKNIPTVRFGNIAAMNEEPLLNPFTQLKQESFLVEMRSIAGYSGSPVVVYIPPLSLRWRKSGNEKDALNPDFHQRLLGINWGHLRYKERAKDESGNNYFLDLESAIAGVVPSWKLLDLIDSNEMIEIRKKHDEKLKKTLDESPMALDSHKNDGNDELTREKFEGGTQENCASLSETRKKHKRDRHLSDGLFA